MKTFKDLDYEKMNITIQKMRKNTTLIVIAFYLLTFIVVLQGIAIICIGAQ